MFEVVFAIILALRLGVPLLIPKFPLPAMLVALVIDGVDQTIFAQVTDDPLEWYQGYDKALDIYYLSIAYLSTIRNWTDPFAFRIGQFLWYYRLVGVVLFELTGVRALLLIFPNTFEYFYDAYEAVRTRWNPMRMSHKTLLLLAAFIWIVIKLPQEWWIHVAQLDFTDFVKEDLLGVAGDTPWGEALGENLWFVALVLGLLAIAAVAARIGLQRAPDPDWRFTFDVDAHLPKDRPNPERERIPLISWYVLEKIAFIALVSIIFAQVLPSTDAGPLQVIVGVAIVVVANAAVSQWLSDRGRSWQSTGSQFVAMLAVNVVIVGAFGLLMDLMLDRKLDWGALFFLLLLLTLIVTMFDRFQRRHRQWSEADEQPPDAAPAATPV